MATQSGTIVLINAGANQLVVDGGSGSFFNYLVPATVPVIRDSVTLPLGACLPFDSVTVTTDGSGNVTQVTASSPVIVE